MVYCANKSAFISVIVHPVPYGSYDTNGIREKIRENPTNPHPLMPLPSSRCHHKFAENFGEFFVQKQKKLAEQFGYYCYSNNSTQQQNGQGNKVSQRPLYRRHFGSDSRCDATGFVGHFIYPCVLVFRSPKQGLSCRQM